MSSVHSFHENAAVATTVGDTDIMPVIQNGMLVQATAKVLRTSGGGVVDTTATQLTITQALHGNRTVTVSSAVPIAITLPQATGTGTRYRFVMQVAATATTSVIKVANATDVMQGVFQAPVTGTAANMAKATTATSDSITLNGTTTGGAAGSFYEITDVKTGVFQVNCVDTSVSFTTTPFGALV